MARMKTAAELGLTEAQLDDQLKLADEVLAEIISEERLVADLRDGKGRRLKVDARVRGTISPGIETHGVVVRIWVSVKHGPVLVIDDGQYEQNVPASQCRRMYGHTEASRETADIARAVRERSEAEPPKRNRKRKVKRKF